jgi:hypothetical protein
MRFWTTDLSYNDFFNRLGRSRKSVSSILHNPVRLGVEEGLFAQIAIHGSSQYVGDVHKNAAKVNWVSYTPHVSQEPLGQRKLIGRDDARK